MPPRCGARPLLSSSHRSPSRRDNARLDDGANQNSCRADSATYLNRRGPCEATDGRTLALLATIADEESQVPAHGARESASTGVTDRRLRFRSELGGRGDEDKEGLPPNGAGRPARTRCQGNRLVAGGLGVDHDTFDAVRAASALYCSCWPSCERMAGSHRSAIILSPAGERGEAGGSGDSFRASTEHSCDDNAHGSPQPTSATASPWAAGTPIPSGSPRPRP